MPEKILILSFSDLARDPRVHRQIRFLSGRYQITAAGWSDPGVEGVTFVALETRPKPFGGRVRSGLQLVRGRFEDYYWRRAEVQQARTRLRNHGADLILANEIDSLPLALELAVDALVLFDAHEYAPREFEDRLSFRLFLQSYREWLCRTYIPRVAAMTTVCESIAVAYESDTGIRPAVVSNAADYEPLEPNRPRRPWRMVHHGWAGRSRKIEKMIGLMRYLDDRFELSLILTGSDRPYLRKLERLAGGDRRIHFLSPVPMSDLPSFLNQFDIGLFLLPPTNFNYRFALPNKLFEFVQARLAVAIGPSPEMAAVVEAHDLGVVASDFDPRSLARELRSLNDDRLMHFKLQSHQAARDLSSESARRTLIGVVERCLERRN